MCPGAKVALRCEREQLAKPQRNCAYLSLVLLLSRFYAWYTDMPQPLPKFDLVAVPGKTYAMEDWGVLMFDVDR